MDVLFILLHLALIGGFLFSLAKALDGVQRIYFLSGFFIRIIAGLGVGIMYFYYYGEGDTIYFFKDAKFLADVAKEDFKGYINFIWSSDDLHPVWNHLTYHEPRSSFFVKFSSFICLTTADNYWISSCYFSIISFSGSWYFFSKLSKLFPEISFPAFISILIFPSFIFWTSGFIKESIANAALLYLSGLFIHLYMLRRLATLQILLGSVSLWLLWSIKYHYVAVFIPVALTALIYHTIGRKVFNLRRNVYKIFLWSVIFLIPLILISFTHPNFYFERIMEVIFSNHKAFEAVSQEHDLIHFNSLEPTLASMLKNAPQAIWSGLFSPTVFDATNKLQWFAAFENFFLLVLTAASLRNIFKITSMQHKLLLLSAAIYVLILCAVITLSTPNFGTLSRYRVGYMPFFVLLILINNPVVGLCERWWKRLVH